MANANRETIGPWQIAELDVTLVNEVFRQIEEYVNRVIGLLVAIPGASSGFPGYATGVEIKDVAATEVVGTSLLVPHGDHVHAHGSGYLPDAHHVAFEALQSDGVDVTLTSRKINLVSGSNVTLTPSAGQISIASTGGGGSPENIDVTEFEASGTSQPWEMLLAGTGITLTELADGHAFSIAAQNPLTNGDTDTPEPVFATGDMVYA